MAAKKADQDIQLSEELQSIVDTVVSKLTDDTNSIDMNTVQVECLARDITSDDDINMVFEALRERGVSLDDEDVDIDDVLDLSLIHISEPTRQAEISYAVFCLKKKKKK